MFKCTQPIDGVLIFPTRDLCLLGLTLTSVLTPQAPRAGVLLILHWSKMMEDETLAGAPGGPVLLSHSYQVAPLVQGLTSSVSYIVLLEEKGEGSGSRSSHGLSADSSSSSPFSGATSHCALLSWGFRVTTTLPGHRPVTGLQGPLSP